MKKYFKTYDMTTVIDVPEECEYIATDANNLVKAFENRPTRESCCWFPEGTPHYEIRPYCDHWSRSLRRLYPAKEG